MPRHKKFTTKQLKHDPFVDWYEKQAERVRLHRHTIVRNTTIIVAVLALIVVVSSGYVWWNARAEKRLGEAFEIFNAEVTDTPPASLTARVYRTDEEKYRAALESYRRVSTSFLYKLSEYGDIAHYYEAVCQLHLNPTQAEADLEQLAQGDSLTSRLSRVALAEHAITKNDPGRAETLYRKLIDDPGLLPKPQLQLGLARALELQGKKADAVSLYVQVANDRMKDLERIEAISRLTQLDPKALDQVSKPEPPVTPPTALDKYTKK